LLVFPSIPRNNEKSQRKSDNELCLRLTLETVQDVLGVDEASIERLRAETNETQVALSRLEYEIQVGRSLVLS